MEKTVVVAVSFLSFFLPLRNCQVLKLQAKATYVVLSTRKCIFTLVIVLNHLKLFFLKASVLQHIRFDIIIKYTVHNLSAAEFTDVAEVRRGINQTAGNMAGVCPCHSPG